MPPRPDHALSVFPNLGQAVLLVLGTLFLQVACGVIIAAVAALSGGNMFSGARVLLNPWTLIAVNSLVIGVILALGLRGTRESAAGFFVIRPFPLVQLPTIVLASLGLAVVLAEADNVIVEILQALSWPGGLSPDLIDLQAYPISGFLLLVVVAPLTEEYLFRGLILRGLLARHRTFVAIGLTALLFGLIHANVRQLFLGVIIGGVFGWWYVRTRSLGPCLIGHALFNAVAWIALLAPSRMFPFTHNLPGQAIAHQPWWFTGGGIMAAAIGLWWFKQLADAQPAPVPPDRLPEDEPPLLENQAPAIAHSPAPPVS